MSKRNIKTNVKMVGLCSICEQYTKQDSYKLRKVGKDPQLKIVCFDCEKEL